MARINRFEVLHVVASPKVFEGNAGRLVGLDSFLEVGQGAYKVWVHNRTSWKCFSVQPPMTVSCLPCCFCLEVLICDQLENIRQNS